MKQQKYTGNAFFSPVIWLCAFIMCIFQPAGAQKPVEYDKIKSFNIIVNYADCTVKTQMLKEATKATANENYVYHWYASNKIMTTKGGFDGKLLHGYYHCFYLNNNLKEAGNFKYGIKTGEWRNWFEDGKLKEIVNWKKGKKNGKYKLYNQVGDLVAESNFKDDKLHGKFKSYSGGRLIETMKYKDGELIVKKTKVKKDPSTSSTGTKEPKVKKEKRSFKERWNSVFKKKNSSTNIVPAKEPETKASTSSATKVKKNTKKKKEEAKKSSSSTTPK